MIIACGLNWQWHLSSMFVWFLFGKVETFPMYIGWWELKWLVFMAVWQACVKGLRDGGGCGQCFWQCFWRKVYCPLHGRTSSMKWPLEKVINIWNNLQGHIYNELKFIQVVACIRQQKLNICWPSSVMWYGDIKLQCINTPLLENVDHEITENSIFRLLNETSSVKSLCTI